jgi:hypothetical protein
MAALTKPSGAANKGRMPLHVIKLSVGAESIQDLDDWWTEQELRFRKAGKPGRIVHTTRMVPKRIDEILDGGSIYWVIKGQVLVRQRITGIEPFTDAEGIGRCHLVFDRKLVPVAPRPKRPFQGWRYLQLKDAPPDLRGASGDTPPELAQELAALGLL